MNGGSYSHVEGDGSCRQCTRSCKQPCVMCVTLHANTLSIKILLMMSLETNQPALFISSFNSTAINFPCFYDVTSSLAY